MYLLFDSALVSETVRGARDSIDNIFFCITKPTKQSMDYDEEVEEYVPRSSDKAVRYFILTWLIV